MPVSLAGLVTLFYSQSCCLIPGAKLGAPSPAPAGGVCYCLLTELWLHSPCPAWPCLPAFLPWQSRQAGAGLAAEHGSQHHHWETVWVITWSPLVSPHHVNTLTVLPVWQKSSTSIRSGSILSLSRTFSSACPELFWFCSGLFVYLSWGRRIVDQSKVSAALINTTFFSPTEITGVRERQRQIYK